MVPVVPFHTVLQDCLVCLQLGAELAAVYLALCFVESHCFWKDVLFPPVAAVLLQAFAAGQSAAGVLRWYMVAAFALGYLALACPFGKRLRRAGATLRGMLTLPLRRAAAFWARLCQNRKKLRKMKEKQKKKLQKGEKVLYNSNN